MLKMAAKFLPCSSCSLKLLCAKGMRLSVAGQPAKDVDHGPSTPEVPPRSERLHPPYHNDLHKEEGLEL